MRRRIAKKTRKKMLTGYRKPTYGAGLRLAQIIYELQNRPLGWNLEGIAEELGIHSKTVGRYVDVLTKEFRGRDGSPLVAVESKWEKSFLKLASAGPGNLDLTSAQIVSLYAAMALLRFVRGSPLYAPLEDAFQKAFENLPTADRKKLTALEKKIHYVPDGPKDYSRHAEMLQVTLSAVFHRGLVRRCVNVFGIRRPSFPLLG